MQSANTLAWTNFGRNQTFTATQVSASDEREVSDRVRAAQLEGTGLRVAGSGHSYTPIVEPTHSLLTLTGPTGVIGVDQEALRAEIWAHTRLEAVGPELWRRGLALRNQGDMDWQTVAGATATGTKGSGARLGSLSSEISKVTLVDGRGDLRIIDDSTEELRAARVSLGLLGVVTRVELQVDLRYGLQEAHRSMSLEEVLETADERVQTKRHFSFCWCPQDVTSRRHHMPDTPGGGCFVKEYSVVPGDHSALETGSGVSGTPGSRIGRSYLIYPDWLEHESGHIEFEYMVPQVVWRDAFQAVRELMAARPDQDSPVQVRWQKSDDSYLSAQYDRDSVSIAMLARSDNDPHQFLRQMHDALLPFNPRPHWGKVHYFDADLVEHAFPRVDEFRVVRTSFDPSGVFLNDHFRHVLGIQ